MKGFSVLVAVILSIGQVALASKKCPTLKCKTGFIGVRFDNGTSPGFISKHFLTNTTDSTFGEGFYTSSRRSALKVVLPSTNVKSDLSKHTFNIKTTNGPNSTLPWLGAAPFLDPIAKDTPGYAFLTANQRVPAGPASGLTSATPFPGESQIWSLTCDSKLAVAWTNKDGSVTPGLFFDYKFPVGAPAGLTVYGHQSLGITGNVTLLQEIAGSTSTNTATLAHVTLQFVPQCA